MGVLGHPRKQNTPPRVSILCLALPYQIPSTFGRVYPFEFWPWDSFNQSTPPPPTLVATTLNHPPPSRIIEPLDAPWWINGPDAPCSQKHKAHSHRLIGPPHILVVPGSEHANSVHCHQYVWASPTSYLLTSSNFTLLSWGRFYKFL